MPDPNARRRQLGQTIAHYRLIEPLGAGGIWASSTRWCETLIREVGFDPVNAGPLRTARCLEPFSLAIAPEIAYRFERFVK